jgi:hypothetical protein
MRSRRGPKPDRCLLREVNAFEFTIPDELLTVMGISVGSTVAASTIKSSKDSSPQRKNIAASHTEDKPRFAQVFLVEEGTLADKIIDIGKFQNFWITILLVVSYVSLAVAVLNDTSSPQSITTLPGFAGEFVVLLAISHGGYIIDKVPNRPGSPQGLTVARLSAGLTEPTVAPTYTPRNP